jgi:hypothetical protein
LVAASSAASHALIVLATVRLPVTAKNTL